MADDRDGIFRYLHDQAGFIDRLELGIRGKRRKRETTLLRKNRTIAIGGPKRMYGRALHGTCISTGNRFQLKYAKVSRFPAVPDFMLVLHSDGTPLTFAQAVIIISALFCNGVHITVSRLELTFDLTKTSVDFFRKHVLTSARQFRTLRDEEGRLTFYVGRPTSGWQVCVYVKTPAVTRFEFKLRGAELRRLGIRQPHEIAFLRTADLFGRCICLREVNYSALPAVDDSNSPGNLSRALIVRKWADNLTSRGFVQRTKQSGIWRPDWLRQCNMHAKLLAMQQRLVW